MRRLAQVEVLLKQTAVGGPDAAPSVLEGAVVRVLIDKVGGGIGLSGGLPSWSVGFDNRKARIKHAAASSHISASSAQQAIWRLGHLAPTLHVLMMPPPAPCPQAYKLRQVSATYIKPETQRLMLVLHVSSRGSVGGCAARLP